MDGKTQNGQIKCCKIFKELRMSIKTTLKKIKWISTLYNRYKIHKMNNLCKDKYIFEGKEKGSDKLCYILAGYKPFLWDIVFKRIKEFVPQDYDLCIVSSGLYNETLSKIAKENGWCYLSTKTNNVALVQNVVISKFAEALYLFKLDEDIFVTKNYFGNLLNLYKHLKNESTYDVGVVSPLIPINGFAHALVLDRYGLVRDYESKFEKILQKADPNRMIENNPDVAKYMWGCGNGLPNIDRMACDLSDDNASYVPAPVKFSIGAILFDRRLWKDMGYFKFKSKKDNCMGGDEGQICSECVLQGRPFVVSKNTIVGHLSFGKQNAAMKEFFLSNKSVFDIHCSDL